MTDESISAPRAHGPDRQLSHGRAFEVHLQISSSPSSSLLGMLEDIAFPSLHQAWREEMPLNQYQKVIESSSYELRL